MQYQAIDQDLNDGKKCCFCCNLETGFKLLGIYGILYGLSFASELFLFWNDIRGVGTVLLAITLICYVLYVMVWLLILITRRL